MCVYFTVVDEVNFLSQADRWGVNLLRCQLVLCYCSANHSASASVYTWLVS